MFYGQQQNQAMLCLPRAARKRRNSKIIGMGKISLGQTLKLLVFKEITGLFSLESLILCLCAILGKRMSGNRKSSKVCGIVIQCLKKAEAKVP